MFRSESNILFSYMYNVNKNSNYEDEILDGTSTSTIEDNLYVSMKVLSNNDRVVRQTDQYFLNHTGKVKRGLFTCILNTLSDSSNFSSYVGFFDDHNDKSVDNGGAGYFFGLVGGTLNIIIRNGDNDNGTDTLFRNHLLILIQYHI